MRDEPLVEDPAHWCATVAQGLECLAVWRDPNEGTTPENLSMYPRPRRFSARTVLDTHFFIPPALIAGSCAIGSDVAMPRFRSRFVRSTSKGRTHTLD